MATFIDTARVAAHAAGEILLDLYGNTTEEYKTEFFDVGSIVTQADLLSEKCIKQIVQIAFPEHSFYGEEGGAETKDSPYLWVVDPLDGTSNFSHNIPLFGISIALLKDGQPILGILYFPKLKLFVEAEAGKGATANGKKISVSQKPIEKSLYYAGGKFRGEMDMQRFPSLVSACGLVKIIDASSFELAAIAMGDAELYVLANILHDVAAGVCIVREAGGKVTDQAGNPWNPESKGIVISNGVIHDQVIELLK